MEIPNGFIHLMRGDLAAGFERLIVFGGGGFGWTVCIETTHIFNLISFNIKTEVPKGV